MLPRSPMPHGPSPLDLRHASAALFLPRFAMALCCATTGEGGGP